MKNRLLPTVALAALASLAGPLSSAGAATRPTVSSVYPMNTKVGQQLRVRGTGYIPGANRNTVIFMSNRGPTVFVKATSATGTTMIVPLPPRLEAGMPRRADGSLRPNRFQLRVVARDPAAWFTPLSKSPVIAPRTLAPPPPPDLDKDGIADSTDPDDDNDLLRDDVEKRVDPEHPDLERSGTDPRRRDTDGDGREDGWEYYSAKDLNSKAVPYPGKRPYPNPLDPDPNEAGIDFDGDYLNIGEEYALWRYTGRSFDADRLSNGKNDSPLGYSDGTQTSRPERPTRTPSFRRWPDLYDAKWTQPTYPDFLSRDGDATWSDDERDADNDGLSNNVEEHGELSKRVWDAWLGRCKTAVTPWRQDEGAYYGAFDMRPFDEPKMMDADSDGDGLLDAEDDQDNDDVPNYSEMRFSCEDGLMQDPDGDGPEKAQPNPEGTANVNPYNPCAPNGGYWTPVPSLPMARTCPRYKPLDG